MGCAKRGLFVLLLLLLGLVNAGSFPGQATAATQGETIVSFAASQAGRPYCFAGGDIYGPTHGTGGRDAQAGPLASTSPA